jgi:hypothetical protein
MPFRLRFSFSLRPRSVSRSELATIAGLFLFLRVVPQKNQLFSSKANWINLVCGH